MQKVGSKLNIVKPVMEGSLYKTFSSASNTLKPAMYLHSEK